MIDRTQIQAYHPFARLNRLLGEIEPDLATLPHDLTGGRPVALSVGEPQRAAPDFVAEEFAKAAAGWSRYPPPRGTPEYLEAAADWLLRRYGLPAQTRAAGGMIDPATAMLPLPGSREGLFFAPLAYMPVRANGAAPAVLIPNPFYHVYAGATAAAGAEPVFVPATAESGFLPDIAALEPAVLDRAGFCYFNSPSNPQGAAADLATLKQLIELARRHDFVIAFDECYSEIYTDRPPPSALQAALELDGTLDHVLVFHSLSKRSSAAGLRCGFVVGAPDLIASLDGLFRVGGAGVPLPVLAAGTRLWQEESHVEANRDFYRANFDVAVRVLGNRFGCRRPDGGFFLWLDVEDGEAAARELWRRAGIRVLPGGYMCAGPGSWGWDSESGDAEAMDNPGARYIRVALVYDAALTEAALGRIAEIL